MKKNKIITILLSLVLAISVVFSIKTVSADEIVYYVTYSTDNYQKKSKNIMTLSSDGTHYVLENQELDATKLFRVESNTNAKYYNNQGNSLSVKASQTSKYNIYFSTSFIYDQAHTTDTKLEKTDCHISYEYYMKPSYKLVINDTLEKELTFNQFNTSYDEYYIDELYLEANQVLSFKDSNNNQVKYSDAQTTYTVKYSGYYDIKYIADKTIDGNIYKYDEFGNYGTGDDYTYNAYIDESSLYYISFKNELTTKYQDADKVEYNSNVLYKLDFNRDTNITNYKSKEFFINERDYTFNYNIYLYDQVTNSYNVIDDDNDSDTVVSKLTIKDLGWYTITFKPLTNEKYETVSSKAEKAINNYYLATNTNNYLYDDYGNYNLEDKYKFVKVEETDDLYDADYEQYKLTITFDKAQVKNNVEFYITDGIDYYKDGTDYIVISKEGTYEILFSKDHIYSRTRHYKFSLQQEDKDLTYVKINNVDDFVEFVENCNNDSTYSINKVFDLTNDINLINNKNLSIKEFNGTFNGNYHSIINYNITSDNSNEYSSLFNLVTKSASINNLDFESVSITSKKSSYVGIIGRLYGTVTNMNVSGYIEGKSYVGVIAYVGNYKLSSDESSTDSTVNYGYAYVTSVNNSAFVYGKSYVGGIAGFNGGKIIESSNNQYINNKSYTSNDNIYCIGGISGYSIGEIIKCTNNSKVGTTNTGSFIGGIAGLSNGAYYFNTNLGDVFGRTNVGGIIGYYTTITESSDSDYSKYFNSNDYEDIINSLINGQDSDTNIDSATNLGKNIILYCLNKGAITSSTESAGGIAGLVDIKADIKGCINNATIEVSSGSYAGGIVGNLKNASVLECISYGHVKVKGLNKATYAGGIAGSMTDANIKYTSSYSIVEGTSYIGGIAGYASSASKVISTISDSYLVITTTSTYTGSVLGYFDGIELSNSTFNSKVQYNYYVSNKFLGIDSKNYGADSDYAAFAIDKDKLVSYNSLSMYLDNKFGSTYFIGGNTLTSYPFLNIFEELYSSDDIKFDNTLNYEELSKDILETLFNEEQVICQKSNIVIYMEWNSNLGDLIDEDTKKINYDNFEINSIIRYYTDDIDKDVKFKYATLKDSLYFFKSDDNNYIVNWSDETENFVYANYTVVSTSLNTTDKYIFVEGEFDSNTKVELVRTGENYRLVFTLNGTEIKYSNVTVKIKDLDSLVYICDNDELKKAETSEFGDYQVFKLSNSNQSFTLKTDNKETTIFEYVITALVAVILIVNICAIVSMHSKKKKKTDAVEETK